MRVHHAHHHYHPLEPRLLQWLQHKVSAPLHSQWGWQKCTRGGGQRGRAVLGRPRTPVTSRRWISAAESEDPGRSGASRLARTPGQRRVDLVNMFQDSVKLLFGNSNVVLSVQHQGSEQDAGGSSAAGGGGGNKGRESMVQFHREHGSFAEDDFIGAQTPPSACPSHPASAPPHHLPTSSPPPPPSGRPLPGPGESSAR